MIVRSLLAAAALAALGGCATMPVASVDAAPTIVQAPQSIDERAAAIVARMSIERKISQLVMPDIASITPADVAAYRFGTILNGGNSGPGGNDKAAAPEWLKLADAMWDASTQPLPDGEPVVPLLWATDAVHGHNNIPGATLFPHNVGLGATRDAGADPPDRRGDRRRNCGHRHRLDLRPDHRRRHRHALGPGL